MNERKQDLLKARALMSRLEAEIQIIGQLPYYGLTGQNISAYLDRINLRDSLQREIERLEEELGSDGQKKGDA
jgi:hypothetical protein